MQHQGPPLWTVSCRSRPVQPSYDRNYFKTLIRWSMVTSQMMMSRMRQCYWILTRVGFLICSPAHTKKRKISRGKTLAYLLSNNSILTVQRPELLLQLPQYVVLSEKKVPAISSDQVTPPTHKGKKTRLPPLKELYMALCLCKCFNWHCLWLRNLVIASTRFSWTHMAFMYLRRKK